MNPQIRMAAIDDRILIFFSFAWMAPAIDFYSEWKTVYVDYSDRLQRAQIDT